MRFSLLKTLGVGGQGVVSLARDAEREGLVAIKRVRESTSSSLLALKAEFRAVSELRHPGLVRLYELGQDAEGLYFTMEAIDGRTLDVYLHGDRPPISAAEIATVEHLTELTASPSTGTATMAGPVPVDELLPRLAAVVPQILAALAALHDRGMVHRDLKPSNVMVTRGGEVKLLDFGILGELGAAAEGILGTPTYMAPEQIERGPVSAATDLYALGVILYATLAGRPPFVGDRRDVLDEHLAFEPDRLETLAPDAPPTLVEACHRLLAKRPGQRPTLEWLDRHLLAPLEWPRLGAAVATAPTEEDVLIGRADIRDRLAGALDRTTHGTPTTLILRGPSGIGKTRLVRWLAAEARARDIPVLRGRARAHERVPYNALDGAIDGLARLSTGLGGMDRIATLQAIAASAFPVFRRDEPTPKRTRAEAFAAVAALLAEVGGAVIAIDDLQWADDDSLALLEALVTAAPRGVLIVGTLRDEARPEPGRDRLGWLDGLDVIAVPALPADDLARVIAQTARRRGMEVLTEDVTSLVAQCDGRPMLAEVIGRGLSTTGGAAPRPLDALLATLPAPAQAILAALEVADQMVPIELLARVVDQTVGAVEDQLAMLGTDGLVHSQLRDGRTELDLYHDVVRATVRARLDDASRVRVHGAFVARLAGDAEVAPERMVRHLLGAGRAAEAGVHAIAAAERARARFAHGLAAEMYEVALAAEHADRQTLLRHLASSLDASARYRQAAARWRELATLVDREDRPEIAMHEASSLLGAAEVVAGYAKLAEAMRALGAPPLHARGVGALLDGARFLIGPLARRPGARPAGGRLDASIRHRVERDIHLANLASYFDPLAGVRFLLRARDTCRRSGATEQLATCTYHFAFMAQFSNSQRGPVRLAERYRSEADALLASLPARGAASRWQPRLFDGIDQYRAGQFDGAARAFDEALAALEEGGVHGSLEHLYVRSLRCKIEFCRQRVVALREQLRRLVAAFDEGGGSTVKAQIAQWGAMAAFLRGHRDEARRIMSEFGATWPTQPPTVPRCLVGLMSGLTEMGFVEPAELRRRTALAVVEDRRFRLLSSMDCAMYWSILALVEARAVLAGDPMASRRAVDRFAERALAAPPVGATRALRARAYISRSPERADALLVLAEREAQRWDQRIDVAVARHQRGKRRGGDEGARLRAQAQAILDDAGASGHWLEEDVV